MTSPKERYFEARVEDAKTVGDAYRHSQENPAIFVAGAQYALDTMLRNLEEMTVNSTLSVEYALALDILDRAKRSEPQ